MVNRMSKMTSKLQLRKLLRVYTLGIPLALLLISLYLSPLSSSSASSPPALSDQITRRLAEQEGCPYIPEWEDTWEGAVLHIFIMFYIFCSLALICDDYFCESLEKISTYLNLSPDVAGATFMAAGSSAPELFVSMADNVFSTNSKSLGVGTIIGSAIFNVLIIIALTALLAGQSLQLDHRPLARDSTWYTVAILVMTVAIYDGEVDVYESALMVAIYCLYVFYMSRNDQMQALLCRKAEEPTEEDAASKTAAEGLAVAALANGTAGVAGGDIELSIVPAKTSPRRSSSFGRGRGRSGSLNGLAATDANNAANSHNNTDISIEEEGEESYFSSLAFPSTDPITSKAWFVFTFPLKLLFRLTIPDCSTARFDNPKGFTATFVISILYIALASHFLVDSATKFGCLVGMPFTLMGLTIIAAGTSVPDAISSIVVAKSGEGDMAVSNAIGSNVFDILLGLGLPFFIANLTKGHTVPVESESIIPSVIILFAVLAAVVGLLVANKWVLEKKVGGALIAVYGAYVIFAYSYELS